MATNIMTLTGASPLSSARGWVTRSFTSLARMQGKTTPNISKVGLVPTRGFLISKRELYSKGSLENLLESGYQFQFNPSELSDVKSVRYGTIGYAGMDYVDYVWMGGSERTISFKLFLDDTPQSKTAYFLGSKVRANSSPHLETTKDGNKFARFASSFGVDTIGDTSISESVVASSEGYTTREHKRGVLDAVERITQYLYPAPIADAKGEYPSTPYFAEGGIVENNTRFRPPELLVFSFGEHYYLEGFLKNASTSYTLFDKDLTPIRAEIDIEFGVIESYKVQKVPFLESKL